MAVTLFTSSHSMAPEVQYEGMNLADVSDEEVVKKILGGETALYEVLVHRYGRAKEGR
jgi:hypothetical protein